MAFGGYRLLSRRVEVDETLQEREVVPEPLPVSRKPPLASAPLVDIPAPVSARTSPALPPRTLQSGEPFEVLLRPQRLDVRAEEVVLELELLLGNRQPEPAENVRIQLTMLSANADQDRHAAAFHAATMLGEGAVPPFDLAPAAGGRIPVRLALPRQALNIVQVGDRPMFVPMVLVDIRWRGGISIRRFGADFMVGTPGQGEKLGPIWLDRPIAGPLSATRYQARAVAAA